MPADLNKPFETRRADVTRINSLGVKLHEYTVETFVSGVGETVLLIPFPVQFTERPAFTTGLALDDNSAPVAGNFPTYSISVAGWGTVAKTGQNTGFFYVAARVVCVLTGDTLQRAWITTTFTGKALRNPTSGDPSLGL